MPQQLASRPNINTHERKCENYEILSCKTSDHSSLQSNAEPNRHWEIKSNVTEDHLQNICLTAKYPWWPQIANLRCMYPKGWISGAFGAVQKPSTVTFYPGGWGNHFCQFRILRRWWNVGELETGGGGGNSLQRLAVLKLEVNLMYWTSFNGKSIRHWLAQTT